VFRVPHPSASNFHNFHAYKAQADEAIAVQAALTDYQKMVAELFDNEISGLGFSALFIAISRGMSLDEFVRYDFLTNVAAFDAASRPGKRRTGTTRCVPRQRSGICTSIGGSRGGRARGAVWRRPLHGGDDGGAGDVPADRGSGVRVHSAARTGDREVTTIGAWVPGFCQNPGTVRTVGGSEVSRRRFLNRAEDDCPTKCLRFDGVSLPEL
jgi:hypothetical protein